MDKITLDSGIPLRIIKKDPKNKKITITRFEKVSPSNQKTVDLLNKVIENPNTGIELNEGVYIKNG